MMTIKEFEGNPLLCPFTTLLAYIDRTKFYRGTVSHLFVLCTTQEPRPATNTTIVRWAKDVMKEAGLGSYKIHSSRSASSTSVLLMGMPLDAIITRVGWAKASTFIKYYMKPILNKKELANKSPQVSASKESELFKDPYNFTSCVPKNTPRGHCGHDGFEKVEKFINHYKPKPKQVYGLTPFAPTSPASTVSYCQEPLEEEIVTSADTITEVHHDPFDFDKELAEIRDAELQSERSKALEDIALYKGYTSLPISPPPISPSSVVHKFKCHTN